MALIAHVYQVFIASPSDVPNERQLARDIVNEWNSVNAKAKKIFLHPVGWEYDSTPEMGDRGQELINKQILNESDLLIGIFWTRIGSPTGKSVSGSVEEIEKHIEKRKPVMLYFSNTPVVPGSIDLDQFSKLTEFKEKCLKMGLIDTFDSLENFRIKLTRQLALSINTNTYFKISEEVRLDNTSSESEINIRLTKHEKLLILEMSKDPNGIVMKIGTKIGFHVQTNGINLDIEQTPRSRALWDETFKTLLEKHLIEQKGHQGQNFSLTLKGYRQADLLNKIKTTN